MARVAIPTPPERVADAPEDSEAELHPRGQLPLDFAHIPSHAEADFLVSAGNQLAYRHVLAWPEWSGPLTLVSGPASSGKSHLARIWADRAGARHVAADELETLSRQGGTLPLVIEDVDTAGAYDEAGLFHLLNQSMRDRRSVLMTARQPVASWPYKTDDLLSRARLASAFSVETDDDVQLSQMFVKLFNDRQVAVDPKLIAYLVARMERSPEETAILVDMMDRLALARGSAITRAIAAEVLALRDAARGGRSAARTMEGDDDE